MRLLKYVGMLVIAVLLIWGALQADYFNEKRLHRKYIAKIDLLIDSLDVVYEKMERVSSKTEAAIYTERSYRLARTGIMAINILENNPMGGSDPESE